MKEIPQLVTKMNDVSETETVNTDNKDTVKQKKLNSKMVLLHVKLMKTTNNTAVDKKSGKQSKNNTFK